VVVEAAQEEGEAVKGHSKAYVFCGDVLEVAKRLPMRPNLVMCSPPYEAARTYGIDFNLKGQDWVDWAVERFRACVEVADGLVCWVLEGQTRQYRWSATPALMLADLHRSGVHLRKPPVFCRVGIPGSGGPDWLRNDWEWCICGSRGGKLPWSNNTAMGKPPLWAPGGEMSNMTRDGTRKNKFLSMSSRSADGSRKLAGGRRLGLGNPKGGISGPLSSHRRDHASCGPDGEMREQSYDAPAIANPGNVIRCKVGGGLMGSPLSHENEAPYPETLAEFFIKSFCPPGGTVWDCFSGSGTTAAAALKCGRNVIASDIRESQCDLTRRRIKEAVGELNFEAVMR
jgi:hypothetical protein